MSTLFSGIQPSGELSVGHYLGTMRGWLTLKEMHRCFFGVMDLHALTVPQEPALLKCRCLDLLAWYLALGLDPDSEVLFVQSHVSEHAQLAWLLQCVAHMGELGRMTQYKDKSRQQDAGVPAGLFTYPVLMAADVLLYGATHVPVGADQKQHLELARDLAQRFNQRFGEVFRVPEPVVPRDGGRIMSLQDPTVKMSKSDPNRHACLYLSDGPDLVLKKLKKAVTDSEGTVGYDPIERPGISNLVALYAAMSDASPSSVVEAYVGKGYGAFKQDLAERWIAILAPMQARFAEWRGDESALLTLAQTGAERARDVAAATLQRAQRAMGLIA